ncbi:MAG: ribonuclease III [Thermodesulfobacteriota bacterium]
MKRAASIGEFSKTLPFEFEDMVMLQKVFVHRSFLNEKGSEALSSRESNERLEFLGDAVLSNVISHLLYESFPDTDEGELTRLRARLVNRHTLAGLASKLRLNDYLLLGKGERRHGGQHNPMILAGVFEALLAAVYLEHGFERASSYIESLFGPLMDESLTEPIHFDCKPRLQEIAQRVLKEAPVYRLIKEEGPPHRKVFKVEVVLGGEVLGTGVAGRKKDAEQAAAGEALKALEKRYDGAPGDTEEVR